MLEHSEAWVIMLNDFPEEVVLGSRSDAKERLNTLKSESKVSNFWHLHIVPIREVSPPEY